MFRLLAILFLTSCLTTTGAASDIDLSQSKIAPETEMVPGGVNVVLKNTGDKPSDGTDLTIGFPQNGLTLAGLLEKSRSAVRNASAIRNRL
jgi:hypothetical protein